MYRCLLIFSIIFISVSVSVKSAERQMVSVGTTASPPTLDGNLDDSCWKNCLPVSNFVCPGGNTFATEQTRVLFCRDRKNLYIAIRCAESNVASMKKPSMQHDYKFMCHNNETVEIMLGPDAKQYFQFMVNDAGTIYDAAITKNTHDLSWDSTAKTATGKGKDFWTVEMAVPLKAFGKTFKNGEKWILNVVRDNPKHEEYSSWSYFPRLAWHLTQFFGYMNFVEETPGLRFESKPKIGTASEVNLTLNGLPEKQSKWQLELKSKSEIATKTLDVPPQNSVTENLKINFAKTLSKSNKKNLQFMIRSRNNKLLARYLYQFNPYFIEFKLGGVAGDLFTVCTDFSTRRRFEMKHNFPGYQGKLGKVKVKHDLIFELPPSCVIKPDRDEKVIKLGEVERKGKRLIQYSLKNPWIYNTKNWRSVVLKTTMPPGEEATGYYYVRWADGQQTPREMTIKCIKVGKVKPPKRFVTSIYLLFLTRSWTDAKFEKYYNLGINTLSVKKPDMSKKMLAVIDKAKEKGFYLLRDHFFPGGFCDRGNYGWDKWTREDREARALDIDGYYILAQRDYQLSPTYRGEAFKKYVKQEIEFIKKTGINWFSFDMEGRIMPYGEKGDFHPRTIAEFKKYFEKNFPCLPYLSPAKFMKDQAQRWEARFYKNYERIWIDFKCKAFADLFSAIKKELTPYVKKTSPWAGVVFSEWSFRGLWDPKLMDNSLRGPQFYKVFDFIEVDAYSGVERFVREQFMREVMLKRYGKGLKVKFIITPSPKRLCSIDGKGEKFYLPLAIEHKHEFKYKIFESAAFGAKGIRPWHPPLFTAYSWRDWVNGIRTINKVEDIILDGNRIRRVSSSNSKIRAHGMKLGSQAFIVVSEYMSNAPIGTILQYKTFEPSVVIDLETDKIIARINQDKTEFQVKLEKDLRARMLLIKPTDK